MTRDSKTSELKITEKEFQAQVIELAKLYKWKVYFTWRSIHSPSGYPDLCMVRLSRLVYAELKSEKGKVTMAQQEWLAVLKATGKCETYIWRPSDWEDIVEELRKEMKGSSK